MSWLSKTLGIDKLAKTGNIFSKLTTAATEIETDVETILAKGADAVLKLEEVLSNPANFGADTTAIVADLKAAVAASQDLLTTLKGL